MPKILIDVDEDAPNEASALLGTTTKKDTVTRLAFDTLLDPEARRP